jgi:hypothetical protein
LNVPRLFQPTRPYRLLFGRAKGKFIFCVFVSNRSVLKSRPGAGHGKGKERPKSFNRLKSNYRQYSAPPRYYNPLAYGCAKTAQGVSVAGTPAQLLCLIAFVGSAFRANTTQTGKDHPPCYPIAILFSLAIAPPPLALRFSSGSLASSLYFLSIRPASFSLPRLFTFTKPAAINILNLGSSRRSITLYRFIILALLPAACPRCAGLFSLGVLALGRSPIPNPALFWWCTNPHCFNSPGGRR